MKATGYVRRFDDLGRIVIPKNLRKEILGTSYTESKPMEFFVHGDCIILKKYHGVEDEWQD